MPGPVSDSYDVEWGTAANAQEIREALADMHRRLTIVLGEQPPIFVLDLVRADLKKRIRATFSEKEWRMLRVVFCSFWLKTRLDKLLFAS